MPVRRSENEHRGGRRWTAVAIAAGLLFSLGAAAQDAPGVASALTTPEPVLSLQEVARQAVQTNPEVLARWHSIRAAEAERDAARGGLLPRMDFTASAGPERNRSQSQYDRSSASLTLSQLLYDGFATRNEVRRLDHAARVRLFEFFDISEGIALEAARAYFDVSRYRELVRLAEENFVEHRTVFAQIERRVQARVARAVDLEQVTGRLALAEANLITETSNLHDTTARFQRLVGRLPTRELPVPAHLAREIPGDPLTAVRTAQQRNPALLAAIESVRSSQAALDTRDAAYIPRFDARLRRSHGRNDGSALADTQTTAAEIVMSWNLFNGFADRARERQFAEQLNVAKDLRDKTCRDVRQTLLIAYNDIQKLHEQLQHLQVHEAAVAKALAAYRMQFDIGQRTLLDLLDTGNELFQARRAVVNARHDLHLAYARTHASQGTLLRALELSSLETGAEADLAEWSAGGDAAQECPVEAVTVTAVDKSALLQRVVVASARQAAQPDPLVRLAPAGQVRAATAAAASEGAATAAATPAPAPAPATPPAAPRNETDGLRSALEAWRTAWAARRVDDYLGAYATGFAPPAGQSRAAWEQRRRAIIGRAADVEITLRDVALTAQGPDRATTTFVQDYRSASYRDSVRKTLTWERVDGRWRIRSEEATPAR